MNEQKTPTEKRREEDQQEQLRARSEGSRENELAAFAREVVHDATQFPGDVVEDARNPERRVDEEQGTPEFPAAEPATGH
jgi:hypothetical protein